jgi:hypothetical protein
VTPAAPRPTLAGEFTRFLAGVNNWGEAVPCDELPYVRAKWLGVSSNGRSQLAVRESQSVGAGCSSVNSASDVGNLSAYHVMGE